VHEDGVADLGAADHLGRAVKTAVADRHSAVYGNHDAGHPVATLRCRPHALELDR
jgi:hypothetical protein